MTANPVPTILQVIPQLDTGGAELSTVEIAEALTRAGGRALVASEGGRLNEMLREAGGELVRMPVAAKNPARMLQNAAELVRLIRGQNVSLIHARSRAPAWSAFIAARWTGIPFVTTYHGAYGQKSHLKSWYNSVMARGDAVIANSRYTAALLLARHAPRSERVHIIHRGVDMERFDPKRVTQDRVRRLRESWGVKPGQRVVLQVARLTRWKGQEVVIDAAARLLGSVNGPDAVFILAGDAQDRTNYSETLIRRIHNEGLGDRVRLCGHCEDVPAACLAADIVVVPSREPEAFGRASAEAQAMERPVIVSDLGALPETVLPAGHVPPAEATGWLVRPGDPLDLAERLHEALSLPPETLRLMGKRARLHVLASFTKYAMQARTLQVYDSLISSNLMVNFNAWHESHTGAVLPVPAPEG